MEEQCVLNSRHRQASCTKITQSHRVCRHIAHIDDSRRCSGGNNFSMAARTDSSGSNYVAVHSIKAGQEHAGLAAGSEVCKDSGVKACDA